MPRPFDFRQSSPHPDLPHCLDKGDGSMVGHNLVSSSVNQKGRRGVGAETEVGEGGDGSYEMSRGGRGPGFATRGTDTVEKEREAMSVFEEREDELGAWVARADPS